MTKIFEKIFYWLGDAVIEGYIPSIGVRIWPMAVHSCLSMQNNETFDLFWTYGHLTKTRKIEIIASSTSIRQTISVQCCKCAIWMRREVGGHSDEFHIDSAKTSQQESGERTDLSFDYQWHSNIWIQSRRHAIDREIGKRARNRRFLVSSIWQNITSRVLFQD